MESNNPERVRRYSGLAFTEMKILTIPQICDELEERKTHALELERILEITRKEVEELREILGLQKLPVKETWNTTA